MGKDNKKDNNPFNNNKKNKNDDKNNSPSAAEALARARAATMAASAAAAKATQSRADCDVTQSVLQAQCEAKKKEAVASENSAIQCRTQANLNAIQQRNEIPLTYEQQRLMNLQSLYNSLLKNQRNVNIDAPNELVNAQKEYYEFKDGRGGYNSYMYKQYQINAVQMKADILNEHNKQMSDMNKSLTYYETQKNYADKISDLLKNMLERVKEKINEIRSETVDTDKRKTFFTNMEENQLSTWTIRFNCILIAYALVFAFMHRNELNQPRISGFVVGILAFVILLKYVLQSLVQLPLSMVFYTKWGFDPSDHKLIWILVTMMFMTVLYIVIHTAKKYETT